MSIFNDLGIREGKGRLKEAFLYNLAACYAYAENRIARILAEFKLSPVKLNALMMIHHVGKDRGLSQVEIGKRMIVTPGNITRLIDRLEKEGLVERTVEQKDRRVKLIHITKKAETVLAKAWPVYKKEIESISDLVEKQNITPLVESLDQLRTALCAK